MFEISFAPCNHMLVFRNQKDLPKIGATRYCRSCKVMRVVDVIHPWWTIRCKNCRYVRTWTCEYGASSKANKHMLLYRHTVLVYLSTDPEGTLSIVQPATSTQNRLEVAQSVKNIEKYGDDPPPF